MFAAERLNGIFKPWLPEWTTLDRTALALSLLAAIVLLRFHFGIVRTLTLCAGLGLVLKLAM